jgi:hypothetical protein
MLSLAGISICLSAELKEQPRSVLAREDIMRKLIRQLLTLLLLACAVWAQSKDFWEKKDYRQWTEKECRKLLDDSPWTDSYSISQIFFDRVVNDTTDRERQANPKIEYKVQIRSALPVRQAIIRLSQINAKYDQLSEEQRKAFDQNADKFLARRDPNPVVIRVNYSATAQLDDRDLTRYWHTQTFDSLKNSTNLIGTKGAKVPLATFRQGAGEAHEFELVFPREHDGQPIIAPGDKTLALEFNHPAIRGPASRIFVEFKVEKMTIQKVPVY